VVLAGEKVTDESVRELADRLGGDPLAAKLLEAMEHGSSIVSLDTHERSSLLAVLEDAPPALHPLRARLREQAEVRERRGRTGAARGGAAERQAVRTNCLVHFPDGKTAVQAVIRRKLEVGAEIIDGWLISHLPQVNEREIDGKLVTTDVWVDKKGSRELDDKLELY
jgi:hypothetical protein